jgi:hypothetical protein
MVHSIKEIQLEFDFMKKGPDPIITKKAEKQESYHEYIKRMYREAREKDANI